MIHMCESYLLSGGVNQDFFFGVLSKEFALGIGEHPGDEPCSHFPLEVIPVDARCPMRCVASRLAIQGQHSAPAPQQR